MGNHEKNRMQYRRVVETFNDLSTRGYSSDLEAATSKAYNLFLGRYVPTEYPSSDFGATILRNIREYCELFSMRRKINIEGGEREVAIEEEAYRSLVLAGDLANNFIVPCFNSETNFSNRIFKDIYNLGLAYLHGIVSAVAQEYVGGEETYDAKQRAVKIAERGIKIHDVYSEHGLGKRVKDCAKKLSRVLQKAQPEFIRPFELVPTSQKKIYRGEELMRQLTEKITQLDSSGKFLFRPEIIFPIAQGGNEFGLRISNAYGDKGHSVLTYPLLYSIKTRRHRQPWTDNDRMVLGRNFENQNLLVTEDWVTTGNTLRGILLELERGYPQEIKVATIKRDPDESKKPYFRNFKFYVGNWSKYKGSKTDSLLKTS